MSRFLDSILSGDCREILERIPGDSVDLVVTSPPYADRRSKVYGGIKQVATWNGFSLSQTGYGCGFLGACLAALALFASRVRPSIPPLFQRVERHFLDGQRGGFSTSGIQRCPQTSHTATRISVHAIRTVYMPTITQLGS